MISRRTAWLVAICATLTMTVSYVDRSVLGVLAPTVTRELDISETGYGWLASAFSMAYLVAAPIAGWWIDRIGARRGLFASVLVWTTVSAMHALVPSFGVLFALRIALGAAESPSFPGSAQTVQRALPVGERARGFGVLFTGSSIGGMLAPPLASYLFGIGGWRFALLASAVVGLVWVPLWLAVTRRAGVKQQLDVAAATPRPAGSVRHVIRHPAVVRGLFAIVAAAPALGFASHWGAKYLHRAFAVDQRDVGGYLWLPPLALDLGAILFGDLASRVTRVRRDGGQAGRAAVHAMFVIGIALTAAFVLLPLATTPWQAMTVVSIVMAGGGVVYTLATAEMLSAIPAPDVATASGLTAASQSLALIIVNPLIGRSVDYFGDYNVAAIALGLWLLPGCAMWLARRPR